ncbi:hypothetical protein BH11PSE11_BH11PSE11_24320 [soil metagenome]
MKSKIKRPISGKFMLAVLATTCSALLVASIAILFLDIKNFQATWVEDLTAQSDILAQVSVPALEFNDRKAATENLAQLKARPHIIGAALYGNGNELFATYTQDGAVPPPFPRAPGAAGARVDGNLITIVKNIQRNGEAVGTVYLYGRYPLAARIQSFGTLLAIVMAVSLIVAALVSLWLQAAVTKPIVAVTSAVHEVVRRRDFSTRVKKSTDDEVGLLVDAFNSMLTEIGERTAALEKSEEALRQLNNTLEERIVARTEELEQAHEQLRQSQKLEAIGQLTGGVAHDFNNVLQVITGNLQLLQMNVAGNPEARKRLETAAFAADRGAKLSSQLLAFARRQPLQPVATNLGRVLRRMDDLLRRALGESIEVETIVTGGLWNSLVDPNQLENVILNLSINARDAMKGEGKLTLELGNAMLDDHYVSSKLDVPAGQYVMLAISDTGVGMSPEVMTRAFEPFFTTKREGEGTGLGLSMAYGFVKQSNGHIKLYSEPGNGTSIKIYLPRSMQPEEELQDIHTGTITGGAETILVVEDDLAVQTTAVDMLTGLGYRVLKANDGQSALSILQSGMPVDMVFTDVVMPGPVRSPELARQAKLLLPDVEVLFTSGYTQNAIVHGGRLDPGVELISKPYRREDLARKIRQMFANRQAAFNAKNAPQLSEDAVPAERPPGFRRFLVVEDQEDSLQMTCELLKMLGHDVQGVGHAEAALEAMAAHEFDVLMTDISLPGMTGVELARKAAKAKPDLKIIFSSGYGAISTSSLNFKTALLPKPFTLQNLKQVLAEIG